MYVHLCPSKKPLPDPPVYRNAPVLYCAHNRQAKGHKIKLGGKASNSVEHMVLAVQWVLHEQPRGCQFKPRVWHQRPADSE